MIEDFVPVDAAPEEQEEFADPEEEAQAQLDILNRARGTLTYLKGFFKEINIELKYKNRAEID